MTFRRDNPIPKGWHPESLSEVSHILFSNVDKKSLAGETPVRLCNYLDVYNNIYITRNLDFMEATASYDEISRFAVEPGDVIITKDSETPDDIGVPAVCIENIPDLVCGYHLALIKPNCKEVDPVFLSSQIAHERIGRYFTLNANGSTRFGLTASTISNTPLWLPPLPEQRRIAEILDAADAAIRETERVIAKLRQVKQGLLHDLLTRGLDAHGHLRDPDAHPEQFKDSLLGRIPKTWEVGTIDDLGINHDRKRIPLRQSDRDQRHGKYPYYGASGIIDWIDDYIFDGDYVLLGEDGANVLTRERPLAFIVRGKFWANNHAHVYEPYPDVNIRFFRELLEWTDYTPIVRGSAQPKITQNALKHLEFVIPSYSEQNRIAAVLDAHDARIRAEEAVLAKRRQVKRGLMDDLLTGRVRV
jgi:type I restriction enzyme S subunit